MNPHSTECSKLEKKENFHFSEDGIRKDSIQGQKSMGKLPKKKGLERYEIQENK